MLDGEFLPVLNIEMYYEFQIITKLIDFYNKTSLWWNLNGQSSRLSHNIITAGNCWNSYTS